MSKYTDDQVESLISAAQYLLSVLDLDTAVRDQVGNYEPSDALEDALNDIQGLPRSDDAPSEPVKPSETPWKLPDGWEYDKFRIIQPGEHYMWKPLVGPARVKRHLGLATGDPPTKDKYWKVKKVK